MKVDFEIIDNSALNHKGRHIDLHNNFDFAGFDYNVQNREFNLHWIKNNGEWVHKNELNELAIIHKEVTYLKITDQDDKSNFEDDVCLGEISFFPSTAREINDSIIPQLQPNGGDDILYFFENGQRIRIHCKKIELRFNEYGEK